MDKDTREELERLEKELLADQPETDELSEEELLADIDLDEIFAEEAEDIDLAENDAYSNYANDYSDDLQEFADNGGEERRRVFGDKLTIGLMITVCVLCLGIIGVLFYWLKNFL